MCSHIRSVDTKTKFVILMHPKEFKKVKNATGHLTNLSLKNSELFVGIDFTNHKEVNKIIQEYDCYILYPSKDAINLSTTCITTKDNSIKKDLAIFFIDSTWACSIKMLRESKNLQTLKHISFSNTKLSQYKIKLQPQEYCLSTIESALSVLELLKKWKIEDFEQKDLEKFLNPFYKMVDYQIKFMQNPLNNYVKVRN